MDILISNASGKPIYDQIASQIKNLIISGQLAQGDSLPSMRLLAQELRIALLRQSARMKNWSATALLKRFPAKAAL